MGFIWAWRSGQQVTLQATSSSTVMTQSVRWGSPKHPDVTSPPNADSFDRVQIFGPFNSGTCLVFQYLQTVFDIKVDYHTLFWKHSLPPRFRGMSDNRRCDIPPPPPEVFDRTLFVCMVRLPYFWILSTLRNPYRIVYMVEKGGDTNARLRSPIRFEDRLFANSAQLWNEYYRAYQAHIVPRAAVVFVRLEDLVQTPETVLSELGQRLRFRKDVDLQRAIAEISNRPARVHSGEPCVYGEQARREYVPERIPRYFTAHDLALINHQLDASLMSTYAYPLVF